VNQLKRALHSAKVITFALFCKAYFETEQEKKALPSEDEDEDEDEGNSLSIDRRIFSSSSSLQSLLPLFLCFSLWVLSSVFSSTVPLPFSFCSLLYPAFSFCFSILSPPFSLPIAWYL
jgi:hypothetical protein